VEGGGGGDTFILLIYALMRRIRFSGPGLLVDNARTGSNVRIQFVTCVFYTGNWTAAKLNRLNLESRGQWNRLQFIVFSLL
jgi:hypothetical protein